MENKIAIGSLSGLLSQSTGKSKKLCDDFLREFFKLASEVLVEGEILKIKGFGTFKVTVVEARTSININTGAPQEIASHKKVIFTPSKEMASAINAPFEEFESVEMEDEIPDDYLMYEEIMQEREPEEEINSEIFPDKTQLEVGSDEEEEDDEITYEAYKDIEDNADVAASIEEYNLDTSANESVNEETSPGEKNKPEDKEESVESAAKEPVITTLPVPYYEEPVKSRFGIGFLTGTLSTLVVCVTIFMLGCFFDWWPVNFGSSKEISDPQMEQTLISEENSENTESPENINEEEVVPVYDTVSTTRYLTTIAREHYGNYNFWPYIYMENESILGHPDRIVPGTQVVVPDLSKYGVDPSNKTDIEAAKKKAVEIYARFK